jgi:hypothetical protein
MTMKHSTKFKVFMTGHGGGELRTNYFTPFTFLGSTITQRKMNGSSCPDNMHIYY